MSTKLGESLLRENLISAQQLKEALEYQRTNGGRLGTTLVKLGIIEDNEIARHLSRQYGVPSVNLSFFEVDRTAVKLVPQDVAAKYMVLPLSRVGATLTLAMVDPTNVFAIDDIKFMTGLSVEPVIVSEAAFQAVFEKFYGATRELELARPGTDSPASGPTDGFGQQTMTVDFDEFEEPTLDVLNEEDEIDIAALERSSEEAPVVKLANVVLVDALRRGASDIHIEPYEKEFRIRYRIDGVLYNIMNP